MSIYSKSSKQCPARKMSVKHGASARSTDLHSWGAQLETSRPCSCPQLLNFPMQGLWQGREKTQPPPSPSTAGASSCWSLPCYLQALSGSQADTQRIATTTLTSPRATEGSGLRGVCWSLCTQPALNHMFSLVPIAVSLANRGLQLATFS